MHLKFELRDSTNIFVTCRLQLVLLTVKSCYLVINRDKLIKNNKAKIEKMILPSQKKNV